MSSKILTGEKYDRKFLTQVRQPQYSIPIDIR